ncbi:MAG: transporter substrate-binding domain-containing protein [Saccharospirillaceae bacterium]|nr:transporter substrate-binding domain-containing protein [Pseudomonadales bacterium]NRB81299.1 transporter substrate-binding domain-containing protein [Saccharospirillaceae bacterium]
MAQTIIISTEEYPPYTSIHLKHLGIDAHIIESAFATQGIAVEFQFFPAARSFNLAKEGSVHGSVPWAKREERKNDFYFSDPLIKNDEEHFFYLKSNKLVWDPKLNDYSKLEGKQIAAINGHDYGPVFQQAEEDGVINVIRVNSIKQCIDMLLKNRIDFFISKKQIANFELNSRYTDKYKNLITSIEAEITPETFDYFIISKKAENALSLLHTFNRGLSEIRKNGQYQIFMDNLESGYYIYN